jgi:predicted nucleotidyltransferase
MPLSKRYLDTQTEPVAFDVDALGSALMRGCPEIVFALLMGSSANGVVGPHSDLDLALYTAGKSSRLLTLRVHEICRDAVGDVRADIGFLNRAEAVYRFEALKGRLLFTRDRETWLRFYSVTCREYEHQMIRYAKQRAYRLERSAA